ncbi:quinohemoprotein amine dehydrogenase subunit alpha [Azospirillum sp.]|uniref:quinohemoprotein amine dehydrogenase subunit alpha n=1 Tax=Azospirillum sp. TaxID=34012 RepID=UPI002D33C618|nr:quinohemoprotein amine dehydrogenase subunit alpha [Azospirillum sp.]HYD64066.1 quinohemoprotein amine dehydrogenase subunit alpha [Azospirillum sp.]
MKGTKRAMLGAAMLALAASAAPAQAQDAEAIVKARCASCHERLPDGSINRISHQRKTPEGWAMTIFRMTQIHGVQITPDETQTLVRWLADNQGLAPEESAPYRYVLERQPAVVETPVTEGDLQTMCARCHSFARIGLQHRDAPEWRKLAHFHLGQWPTTEYQALGRDRKWWEIASTEVPERLGKMQPLKTAAWDAWKGAAKPDLSGTWAVAGHRPGKGAHGGTVTVTKKGDGYTTTYTLTDAGGQPITGSGTAVVYTGYEWRGTLTIGNETWQEVLAASKDGSRIAGRVFLAAHDEVGAMVEGVKVQPGTAVIAGVSRTHLKAGETARITVWGAGLSGNVSFGPGVTAKVVSQSPTAVVVDATAEAGAAVGARTVTVGTATAAGPVVYKAVDTVKVEPDYAIARVGANGGPVAPVTAQFEAVGYLNGPDGQPGTADDVRLGALPADWSLEPFNEPAKVMEDVKFAGTIDKNGLFTPAAAGPNPARVFGTNNVGDLKVVAAVKDGGNAVQGEGRLIATVQRWNDPPIR